MLLKVVSRLKRRFRRTDARHSQPPELRRWSDFMNPFPHVEPGGYTKYYRSRGLLDADVQFATPTALTASMSTQSAPTPSTTKRQHSTKARVNPLSSPDQSSATLMTWTSSSTTSAPSLDGPSISTSTVSLSRSHASKKTLMVIREESLVSMKSGKRCRGALHTKSISERSAGSSTASLRRRKRRMLRAPSMERDLHSDHTSFSIAGSLTRIPLDDYRTHNVSCTESAMSSTSMCHSPNAASTSLAGGDECTCGKDEEGILYGNVDDGDNCNSHPERPDSRSSYWTARSEFGD
ncbi:hypothetical protein AMATHDRAFT_45344 [Amanita thiersii Skay4041]|uniref:Uncharacterized protein n=1 Tax=Amanita thiersii Skay4041 TaxID=703135 RepID=A0A2A9NTN7_9AGAR|nr:hypothetical protein AMATHDRAFT_45344 [Amanita thiersii Skay4041]